MTRLHQQMREIGRELGVEMESFSISGTGSGILRVLFVVPEPLTDEDIDVEAAAFVLAIEAHDA